MDHDFGIAVGDDKAAIDEWYSSQRCVRCKPYVTSKFARGVLVVCSSRCVRQTSMLTTSDREC
jgi:hypothetical protein